MIEIKDKVQIQDLVVSEPSRTTAFFNAEDYLNSSDFEPVMELVESKNDKIRWLDDLFQIRIAAPDWYKQIETEQSDIQGLKARIDNDRYYEDEWLERPRLLSQALLAFPEYRNYLMDGIDRSNELIEEVNKKVTSPGLTIFDAFDPLFYLTILYPDRAKGISLGADSRENLKRYGKNYFRDGDEPMGLRDAAQKRIMFPDDPEIYKLKDDDWSIIKRNLQKKTGRLSLFPRSDQVHKFMLDLASAKILAAPEVQFTKEKGLQFISQVNRSINDDQKIPDVRKF